ncbi:S8 family serine peptidase [Tenacibaculum xiamenense]|uniref:S8 family serine peptidase n=1 Tax=Tenacibaculum xiamenense TaxID=1261553 RepID=UPI00389582D4
MNTQKTYRKKGLSLALALVITLQMPMGAFGAKMKFAPTFEALPKGQQTNLKKRVKDIRKEKGVSFEERILIDEFKADKKALKDKRKKEKRTTKRLSLNEKKVRKSELKAQKEKLREINKAKKKSLDKKLKKKLNVQERTLLKEVEPVTLFELQNTPNDPEYGNQWGYQSLNINTFFDDVYNGTSVNLNTPEKVTVAVIDSGVDFNHEELQGSMWQDANCVDENNQAVIGGCMNGGYDFVDSDTNPYPTDGLSHGTTVSGMVNANTNNAKGISSIGHNTIELMALRACCDSTGLMKSSDIADAINFAVNNGVDVINASFGGPTYSQEIYDAIVNARNNNIPVVVAAGNYATNNDTDPTYPASYDLDNIIAVGSTTSWDHLAYFSNYGLTVDIAAPGQDIWGIKLNNVYEDIDGTSFSAPQVTAVVAHMIRAGVPYNSLQSTLWGWVNSLPALAGKTENGRTLRFEAPAVSSPICGNLVVEAPEQCDDGNTENGDGCNNICQVETVAPICGNLLVETNEQCDDGNTQGGDGCSNTCQIETVAPICGNSIVETGEQCDDGNTSDGDGCNAICGIEVAVGSMCGNGIVEGFEACDDGNTTDGDGCSTMCLVESTGGTGLSGVTIPVASSSTGNLIFHHEDHLSGGNVDTDSTGAVVQLLDYYPFGDTRIDDSASNYENDYKYTGKEKDEDTGLYYYEARYYGSSIGRFASRDNWSGDITDPQTLNKYTYVRNNPVNYNDPTGNVLDTVVDAFDIATGVVKMGVGMGFGMYGTLTGDQVALNVANQNIKDGSVGAAIAGVAFFIPFASSPAIKGGGHVADKVLDVGKYGDDVIDTVKNSISKLNNKQLDNFNRFKKKIPSNAKENINIRDLPNRGKVFEATSSAKNIPGSKAIYQKQINQSGKTLQYYKTTYDKNNKIIHSKNKIPNKKKND